MFTSRRQAQATIVSAAAGIALLAVMGAWAAWATIGDARAAAPTATATTAAAATSSTAGCQDVAVQWVSTLIDKRIDGSVWASRMSALTAPEVVQSLGSVDRARMPDGPVAGAQTVSQPGSCDVTVTVTGAAPVAVQAEQRQGRWVITGWAAP